MPIETITNKGSLEIIKSMLLLEIDQMINRITSMNKTISNYQETIKRIDLENKYIQKYEGNIK